MTLLEVSTTNYGDDVLQIKKALSHLETRCGAPGTCALSEPVSRFGWTFFRIAMKPVLVDGIEAEFADMIQRYRDGKPEERLVKFLSDFFESRDCKIKLKIIEY